MEQVSNSSPNLVLPSPSFVLIHGNKDKFMTFCPIKGQGKDVSRKIPRELQNKDIKIQLGCDSWLIVYWTEDKNRWCRYSLWNANTMEDPIYFPKFKLKPEHKIEECLLTAPPGDPNCMLVVFALTKDGPSLCYCREGAKEWTTHLIIHEKLSPNSGMWNPVMFNGKIYCLCHGRGQAESRLADIDIKSEYLQINFSDFVHPWLCYFQPVKIINYMVESFGELFFIVIFYFKNFDKEELILSVGLFKMDLLKLNPRKVAVWKKVDSFEEKAFFVSPSSRFACPAIGSILGNHIYFTLVNDGGRRYAFNMKSQTSMTTLSCSYSKTFQWVWVKSDLRLSDPDDKGEDIYPKNQEIVKQYATIEGDSGKLPFEMLVDIGRRLKPLDYMNFRSVNTMFKEAAPLNRWKKSALKGFEEGSISSSPLLMSQQIHNGVWSFIDPLNKVRYFITRYNELENGEMSYSKGGWCVVIIDMFFVVLWHPFAKKIIQLPQILTTPMRIIGSSFSSLPDSPESDCTITLLISYGTYYGLNVTVLGSEQWEYHFFKIASNFSVLTTYNSPILYYEAFYLLDMNGNLGVFEGEDEDAYDHLYDFMYAEDGDESYFEVLNYVIDCPSESFDQAFLLECDDKLLSVFVSFSGYRVQVFELDEYDLEWYSMENLGNNTIYLSRSSSFSTKASPGMQNRIYFPRYYGKKGIVYYSLESTMLHSDDTDEVLENFYVTEEQLFYSWITPTF